MKKNTVIIMIVVYLSISLRLYAEHKTQQEMENVARNFATLLYPSIDYIVKKQRNTYQKYIAKESLGDDKGYHIVTLNLKVLSLWRMMIELTLF